MILNVLNQGIKFFFNFSKFRVYSKKYNNKVVYSCLSQFEHVNILTKIDFTGYRLKISATIFQFIANNCVTKH